MRPIIVDNPPDDADSTLDAQVDRHLPRRVYENEVVGAPLRYEGLQGIGVERVQGRYIGAVVPDSVAIDHAARAS